MELLGARLGHDVDLRPGTLPELRRVVVGLDLELLQRVDTGAHADSVVEGVGVGRAVDLECVLVGPQAVRREAVGASAASLCTRGNARHQKGELGKVPAVERQRQNLLRVQYGSQRGGLALDQRSLARDRDAVGHLADFHLHFDTNVLIHLEGQTFVLYFLETLKLKGQIVLSRRQTGQIVFTLIIGNALAAEACGFVHRRHTGANDNRALRVSHIA